MKGGVGKTTICVNLAYAASKVGFKTLLVDLDPQGASSFYFRTKPRKKFDSSKLLSGYQKVYKSIKGSDYDFLDILPASVSYRNLDIELDLMKKSKKQLKNVLKQLKDDYDIIFIDSPPNLTLLSENIFEASDLMIIPLIPTPLSLNAYNKLSEFLTQNNKKLKCGVTFSMLEKRKEIHRSILQNFTVSKEVLHFSPIPNSSQIEKMGQYREPILAKHPKGKASEAFTFLWNEVREFLYPQLK